METRRDDVVKELGISIQCFSLFSGHLSEVLYLDPSSVETNNTEIKWKSKDGQTAIEQNKYMQALYINVGEIATHSVLSYSIGTIKPYLKSATDRFGITSSEQQIIKPIPTEYWQLPKSNPFRW